MAAAGFGIGDGAGGFVTKLEGDGDAKIGNSADDVIQITGSLKVAGGAVFNEGSIAADFRVESNASANMFFIDGTNNRIGIDTANPAALLHISSSTPGTLFRIDHPDSTIDNPIFFVTGSAGQSKVGIGTETPDATFAISDDGKVFEVGSANEGSWLEVNNGAVYLNQGGGYGISGGTFLGQRFNIAPINATYGALGIGKYAGSTQNIVEVNSANSDLGGDFFVIDSDGKAGIGTTTPTVQLHVTSSHDADSAILAEGNGITIKSGSTDSYGSSLKLMNQGYSHATIGLSGSALVIAETSSGNGQWQGAVPLVTVGLGADASGGGSGPTQGYVGINTSTPSTELEVNGAVSVTGKVIFGTTSTDLGSGTTSTLTPASSIHLLTATSITSGGGGMHIMSIANGTTAGQLLKVVMNTTTNNQPIMISTANILGGSNFSAIAIEPNKQGAALDFAWTGSKWALMGNNALASAS